jgi:hypothetical protein
MGFQVAKMSDVIIPTLVMDNLVVSLPPLVVGKGQSRIEYPRFGAMYADKPDTIWITETYPDSINRGLPCFAVMGWYFGGIVPFVDNISTNPNLARLCQGLDGSILYNSINSVNGGAYMRASGYITQGALDNAIQSYLKTSKVMSAQVTALRSAGITAATLRQVTESRTDLAMLETGATSPLKALPETNENLPDESETIGVTTPLGDTTEDITKAIETVAAQVPVKSNRQKAIRN